MNVLTADEYVMLEGMHCPYCHMQELLADNKNYRIDGVNLYIPIKCEACGKHFEDKYSLEGYEEEPDNE